MSFQTVCTRLAKNEGGYVNNPADPGGETKFGISKRYHPELDIAKLTLAEAEVLWLQYWNDGLFASYPAPLQDKLFDMSFPMGLMNMKKCLQGALNSSGFPLKIDGIIGAQTTAAMRQADPLEVLAAFRSECAGHFRFRAEVNPHEAVELAGLLNRSYQQ